LTNQKQKANTNSQTKKAVTQPACRRLFVSFSSTMSAGTRVNVAARDIKKDSCLCSEINNFRQETIGKHEKTSAKRSTFNAAQQSLLQCFFAVFRQDQGQHRHPFFQQFDCLLGRSLPTDGALWLLAFVHAQSLIGKFFTHVFGVCGNLARRLQPGCLQGMQPMALLRSGGGR
jgi:hypothetical protein